MNAVAPSNLLLTALDDVVNALPGRSGLALEAAVVDLLELPNAPQRNAALTRLSAPFPGLRNLVADHLADEVNGALEFSRSTPIPIYLNVPVIRARAE